MGSVPPEGNHSIKTLALGESSEEKDERIPRVFSFVPMKKR